jgi:hypothetical protein
MFKKTPVPKTPFEYPLGYKVLINIEDERGNTQVLAKATDEYWFDPSVCKMKRKFVSVLDKTKYVWVIDSKRSKATCDKIV